MPWRGKLIGRAWAASLALWCVSAVTNAQDHGVTPADVERGGQTFLATCATCHGPDADGIAGANLATGTFRRGTSDQDLVTIIQRGIPGTAMPPHNLSDAQAALVVAYLRSLPAAITTLKTTGLRGDPAKGKSIYDGKGNCGSCHLVNGAGGFLGPDLSSVGLTRRTAELERALTDPSADIRTGSRTASVVLRDGTTIMGRLLNQDTYSLQLLDVKGKLWSLRKDLVRQWDVPEASTMPSFAETLTTQALADVVSYLKTLKTAAGAGGPEGRDPVGPAGAPGAQVTFDRLLKTEHEPQNWLTYSGSLTGQRYSLLAEITPQNVPSLQLEWVLQTRAPAEPTSKYEATSLVVDGVLYSVQPPNVIVAADAVTGRVFWTYAYNPSVLARACCGRVNRGLAILGHTLFMGTIDGNLVAVDARDGRLLWTVHIGKPEAGYSVTMAPLVVKHKVLVGTGGGEYGISGFLAAYDPDTGKQVWKFNTVPQPGEPGHDTWAGESWKTGSGSIWTTGTYDPEQNLIYWGVGNPGPDWSGDSRLGDNLYTSSVIALDADTGKLRWHFQFTPHDEFDFDATQVPVLADMDWHGTPRKLLMLANRNGFFYVLDRLSGQFLSGTPFTKQTWASGLDSRGRPVPALTPSREGTLIYPNNQGGTNWYSPSFSPRSGLFYIPTWVDTFSTYAKRADQYVEGNQYNAGAATHEVPALNPARTNTRPVSHGHGAITAIDPRTGEMKWQFNMTDVTDSGVLSTASGLIFAGGREGYFYALDASTGAVLWKAMVGGPVAAGPITYAVEGRQYVSVPAGNAVFTFALPRPGR